MADEIKRINVRIGGMSYQLISSENEAYTRSIALKADEMIRRVMQGNPQLSLNMATVLALVNSLDELAKVLQHLSSADSGRQDIEKQMADTRKELMRLREQNWEMKKELLRVNALNNDYEALLAKKSSSGSNRQDTPGPENDPQLNDPQLNDPPESPQPENPPAENMPPSDFPADRLKQTNFEDYLRENGWPHPLDP